MYRGSQNNTILFSLCFLYKNPLSDELSTNVFNSEQKTLCWLQRSNIISLPHTPPGWPLPLGYIPRSFILRHTVNGRWIPAVLTASLSGTAMQCPSVIKPWVFAWKELMVIRLQFGPWESATQLRQTYTMHVLGKRLQDIFLLGAEFMTGANTNRNC